MTLPTGQISMSQVNTELGLSSTSTISLNQASVRALAGVPTGAISMNNLRGKSAYTKIGNPAKGYLPHLINPAFTLYTSYFARFSYPTETFAYPTTTISRSPYETPSPGVAYPAYTSFSSSTKGYITNQFVAATPTAPKGETVSHITSVLYSNDTTALLSARIAEPEIGRCGVSSISKGYAVGGYETILGQGPTTPAPNLFSSISGIIFSNDTSFNPAATTASAGQGNQRGTQSNSKGYLAGGWQTTSFGAMSSSINTINFSNDSWAPIGAKMGDGARSNGTTVFSSTKGYYTGGYLQPSAPQPIVMRSFIDGILFSNDTAFNPAITNGGARFSAGQNSSPTRGYMIGGGGSTPTPTPTGSTTNSTNVVDGINFSNDTAYNPALTFGRKQYFTNSSLY